MAMTLRLSDADDAALELLAREDGVSKQEATIRAIREAAERRGHASRVSSLSAHARLRYADVIRRLGE